MPTTPRHERARVAVAVRNHGPDAPQAVDARRDLAAANLAAYITKTLAAAPPLTPAQVHDLRAMLLRGGELSKGAATSTAAAS